MWAIVEPLHARRHSLSLSLLQRFASGSPFLGRGTASVGAVDSRPYVDLNSLGFAEPPTRVTYWFFDRDAFMTDDIAATDLAVNYSFHWRIAGKDTEAFLQPEILNVFNRQGARFENSAILDATNDPRFATFDPFTEDPIEGVHFAKGPQFGEPASADDFQQPRTFRFSVGLRF